MEAESVPTFPSPSTSFPLFNRREKYNRLKRLTNKTNLTHLLSPDVESKILNGIYKHFCWLSSFLKGAIHIL